jgi:hypothetical protein
MKLIDKEIATYIVHCLFPTEVDTHLESTFEYLTETHSSPLSPVFSNVLNMARWSDPANEMTQANVREYIVNLLREEAAPPRYSASFFMRDEHYVFMIYDEDKMIGFAVSTAEKFSECCEALKEQFPDIRIQQKS